MRFYNNLYAGFVSILKDLKNFNPQYTAIFLVATCQLIHLLLLFKIIKLSTGMIILDFLSLSKYNILWIAIPVFIVLYIYYSGERINKILNEFEKKANNKRVIWQVAAMSSFIVPIIVFVALSTKK